MAQIAAEKSKIPFVFLLANGSLSGNIAVSLKSLSLLRHLPHFFSSIQIRGNGLILVSSKSRRLLMSFLGCDRVARSRGNEPFVCREKLIDRIRVNIDYYRDNLLVSNKASVWIINKVEEVFFGVIIALQGRVKYSQSFSLECLERCTVRFYSPVIADEKEKKHFSTCFG